MGKKNDIRKRINFTTFEKKKICYKLSFFIEKEKSGKHISDPQYMNSKELIQYLNSNYNNDKKLDVDKIINDLIVFKSYRQDLEISIKKDDLFSNFMTDLVTIFIGVVALMTSLKDIIITYDILISFLKVYALFTVLTLIMYKLRTSKKYLYEHLKAVNINIYTLEAIKKEMEKGSTKYESEIKRNENKSCKMFFKKLEEKISKKAEAIRAKRG